MFEVDGFEVFEIVAEYKIFHPNAPRDMTVKVYQYETGKYEGHCSYSYWGPGQMGPYQHSVPRSDTKEGAVKDVLHSLMLHHEKKFSADQFGWVKIDDPQKLVVLGSGEVVSQDDFLKANRKKE